MGLMTGKVAVVAGGGRGVGAECARLLASEGAKIVLADPEVRHARRIADEILSTGGSAMFLEHDPDDAGSWPRLFELASRLFGPAGIFVNAAASTAELSATETGTQCALASMIRTCGSGSIVNLAPQDGEALSDALHALTCAAAERSRSSGHAVRVNTVVPARAPAPDAREVARAVLYLASEDSNAFNGRQWLVHSPD